MAGKTMTIAEYAALTSHNNARVQEGAVRKLSDGSEVMAVVIKRKGFRDVRGVVMYRPEAQHDRQ